jgi:hypothetical protein
LAETENRRSAPRFDLRAPTEYSNGREGRGTTENISVSGALIENISDQRTVGTRLELRFSFFAGSYGTPFAGQVVRLTERGFAVEFSELDGTHRRLLHNALPRGADTPES